MVNSRTAPGTVNWRLHQAQSTQGLHQARPTGDCTRHSQLETAPGMANWRLHQARPTGDCTRHGQLETAPGTVNWKLHQARSTENCTRQTQLGECTEDCNLGEHIRHSLEGGGGGGECHQTQPTGGRALKTACGSLQAK